MSSYEGRMIADELESMSEIQAKTFAAACAELLIRFFATGIPLGAIGRDDLRAIVDTLWNSTSLEMGYAGDAASDSERLHLVLLGDDAEEVGGGEFPISGIYYAIQAIHADIRRRNELVARKLYETAYFTILARQESGIVSDVVFREAGESSLAQQVLSFISAVLLMAGDVPVRATCASVRSYAESFMLT